MKAGKGFIIILSITMILFGVSYGIEKLNNPGTSTDGEIPDSYGIVKDSDGNDIVVDKIVTESGATLEGNLAKTVKQFKTLAEAEEDMGYYLGLHNTVQSHEEYRLVGMYRIGENEWYQAAFDCETNPKEGFTLKVSKTMTEEEMLKPYEDSDFRYKSTNFYGFTAITYESLTEEKWNLASFTCKNGKVYSLYTGEGIERKLFEDIVSELLGNLIIMDDWVE